MKLRNHKYLHQGINVTRFCLDPYTKCNMLLLTPLTKVKDLLDTTQVLKQKRVP